jgi:hypothetical protein
MSGRNRAGDLGRRCFRLGRRRRCQRCPTRAWLRWDTGVERAARGLSQKALVQISATADCSSRSPSPNPGRRTAAVRTIALSIPPPRVALSRWRRTGGSGSQASSLRRAVGWPTSTRPAQPGSTTGGPPSRRAAARGRCPSSGVWPLRRTAVRMRSCRQDARAACRSGPAFRALPRRLAYC